MASKPAAAPVVVGDEGDEAEVPEEPAPGCTKAQAEARKVELEKLTERIYGKGAEPRALLPALRALIARPCLRHVAQAVELPEATTIAALQDAWSYGLGDVLEENFELPRKDGRLHLVIPRGIVPSLDAGARAQLAPFLCKGDEPGCTRAASYQLRAEQVFEAELKIWEARLGPPPPATDGYRELYTVLPASECNGHPHREEAKPATFELWAACVGVRTPRAFHYAADAKLRAPDRGWLVLRGRRGHYQFADEIRAYDLATGAAYVVSEAGGLLVGVSGETVPPPQAYTGSVAADQVRELAFFLISRPALVELRLSTTYAVIPDDLPRTLSNQPVEPDTWGRVSMRSSDQTTIDFVYFDGALRHYGSFTWPQTYDGVDTHADDLIRVMEAGLVRTCAPAKLPPQGALRGAIGKVSSVDAAPDQLAATHLTLDQQLESLRKNACPGAK